MSNKDDKSMFDELKAWMDSGAKTQITEDIIQKSNTSCPVISKIPGTLGARIDNHVILNTGQLYYQEKLIELVGHLPIELSLNYISREPHSGIFGKHWFFNYESRFQQTTLNGEKSYRLYLCDGRKFDFTYEKQTSSLQDKGNLGVKVSWDDRSVFELSYFTGEKVYYQNSQLIAQVDKNGNRIDLDYDDKGRLETIRNSSNAQLIISYDNNNRVSDIRDHGGRLWQFDYDPAGMLSEIGMPEKARRVYHYSNDEQNQDKFSCLLSKVSNTLQQPLLEIKYNSDGKVFALREKGIGDGATYQYDDPKNIIIKNQEPNQKTFFYLNKQGLIESIYYPNKTSHYKRWDEKIRTVTVGTSSGIIETKVLDNQNRVLELTNKEGNKFNYTYVGANLAPTTIKSPTGETHNTYDEKYNLLKTTDEKNRKVSYLYNSKGDITQITDAEGNTSHMEFNPAGQVISNQNAHGDSIQYEYDNLGREIKFIDAEGNESNFEYNLDNTISTISNAVNNTIYFDYNQNGELIKLVDPARNQTSYNYNQNSQICAQINPDGATQEYTYHENGRLATIKREEGSTFRYVYNLSGNLIQEITPEATTNFEYDNFDKLIKVSTENSIVEFSYNSSGEIETEIQDGVSVEKTYVNNEVVHLGFLDESVSYQRDAHGLLQSISRSSAQIIKQHYNKNNYITKRCYPNQQNEIIKYNETGQINCINTAKKTIQFKTDKNGFITQKDDTKYRYDESGRLIHAGNESYEYDDLGNLILKTQIYSNNKIIKQQSKFNSKNNQLNENENYNFKYDKLGNLVKKTHKTRDEERDYTYNANNQLTKVQGRTFNYTTKTVVPIDLHFKYDAIGRRIEKKYGAIIKKYLYDKLNIIAITTFDNIDEISFATIVHDDVIDEPLSITNENGTFYYHRDHQGSIIGLTNESGEIVESFCYDNSYGNIIEHKQLIDTSNPYCYTGREYDSEDLFYYRARYYDPQTARFLTRDPIEFDSGDVNFYRYVGNNPINYVDPYGLESATATWGTGHKSSNVPKSTNVPKSIPSPSTAAKAILRSPKTPWTLLFYASPVGKGSDRVYPYSGRVYQYNATTASGDGDVNEPEPPNSAATGVATGAAVGAVLKYENQTCSPDELERIQKEKERLKNSLHGGTDPAAVKIAKDTKQVIGRKDSLVKRFLDKYKGLGCEQLKNRLKDLKETLRLRKHELDECFKNGPILGDAISEKAYEDHEKAITAFTNAVRNSKAIIDAYCN